MDGTIYWTLIGALFFTAGLGTMYVVHRILSRREEKREIRREISESRLVRELGPTVKVRPRKLKYPSEAAEERAVVEELPEESEYRQTDHSPTDLDRALTAAVYRAITDRKAGLNLTLTFPEKCRIFGQEVAAKGSVVIDGADHEEVLRLEKRIAELEQSLTKAPELRPGNGLVAGKRAVRGLEENPLF